jgi:hypothetical protein
MYGPKRLSPGLVAWLNRRLGERTRREIARRAARAAR